MCWGGVCGGHISGCCAGVCWLRILSRGLGGAIDLHTGFLGGRVWGNRLFIQYAEVGRGVMHLEDPLLMSICCEWCVETEQTMRVRAGAFRVALVRAVAAGLLLRHRTSTLPQHCRTRPSCSSPVPPRSHMSRRGCVCTPGAAGTSGTFAAVCGLVQSWLAGSAI